MVGQAEDNRFVRRKIKAINLNFNSLKHPSNDVERSVENKK
jgi:hypothetical protein